MKYVTAPLTRVEREKLRTAASTMCDVLSEDCVEWDSDLQQDLSEVGYTDEAIAFIREASPLATIRLLDERDTMETALAAEREHSTTVATDRDETAAELAQLCRVLMDYSSERDAARAERDALAAEVEALRARLAEGGAT